MLIIICHASRRTGRTTGTTLISRNPSPSGQQCLTSTILMRTKRCPSRRHFSLTSARSIVFTTKSLSPKKKSRRLCFRLRSRRSWIGSWKSKERRRMRSRGSRGKSVMKRKRFWTRKRKNSGSRKKRNRRTKSSLSTSSEEASKTAIARKLCTPCWLSLFFLGSSTTTKISMPG